MTTPNDQGSSPQDWQTAMREERERNDAAAREAKERVERQWKAEQEKRKQAQEQERRAAEERVAREEQVRREQAEANQRRVRQQWEETQRQVTHEEAGKDWNREAFARRAAQELPGPQWMGGESEPTEVAWAESAARGAVLRGDSLAWQKHSVGFPVSKQDFAVAARHTAADAPGAAERRAQWENQRRAHWEADKWARSGRSNDGPGLGD
jgi:membrane protein involved in colicin uptake